MYSCCPLGQACAGTYCVRLLFILLEFYIRSVLIIMRVLVHQCVKPTCVALNSLLHVVLHVEFIGFAGTVSLSCGKSNGLDCSILAVQQLLH